jgi:hypothetical protein
MKPHPSLPSPQPIGETMQERLLRDAFQQHANVPTDVDQAWMQIAQRMPELHTQAGQVRFPFWLSHKQPRKARRMRRLSMVASLALVAVLLMGAGVATGLTPLPFGNILKSFLSSFFPHISTSQFQTIKEQQSSNGVTITLENAYASIDRTIIAFTLQISPDLSDDAGGFAQPGSYTFVVNGQKETLTNKDVSECLGDLGKGHFNEYCIVVLKPMRVPASTKQLTVLWNITSISITLPVVRSPSHSKLVHVSYHKFSGHWSFHFTLPFHHQNLDPGKPPQPTN